MHLSSLLKEIEAKTTISDQWQDGNYLADLLLELGSYYATLGTHVAEAERDANLLEAHYKMEREKTKLGVMKEGKSATAADSSARVATAELEQDAIALRYKARLLSLSRDGLGTNIDTIRSKLSYLKTEQGNPQ